MLDRILQEHNGRDRQGLGDPDRTSAEAEATDDLGAFGWLRGIRDRAVRLELRKKTGNVLAVDYGGMEVELDPSAGITLHLLSGRKIRIKGRNLNAEVQPTKRLFEGIVRQRVPWVQEAGQAGAFQAEKGTTVVEAIEW